MAPEASDFALGRLQRMVMRIEREIAALRPTAPLPALLELAQRLSITRMQRDAAVAARDRLAPIAAAGGALTIINTAAVSV